MEETETTLRKRTLAILHREIWFRSWSGRRAAGSCSSADLVSYTVARSRSASTSFTSLALNNPPPPALAAYGTLSLHGERGMGSQSTSCRHREVEPRTTSFIASFEKGTSSSSSSSSYLALLKTLVSQHKRCGRFCLLPPSR